MGPARFHKDKKNTLDCEQKLSLYSLDFFNNISNSQNLTEQEIVPIELGKSITHHPRMVVCKVCDLTSDKCLCLKSLKKLDEIVSLHHVDDPDTIQKTSSMATEITAIADIEHVEEENIMFTAGQEMLSDDGSTVSESLEDDISIPLPQVVDTYDNIESESGKTPPPIPDPDTISLPEDANTVCDYIKHFSQKGIVGSVVDKGNMNWICGSMVKLEDDIKKLSEDVRAESSTIKDQINNVNHYFAKVHDNELNQSQSLKQCERQLYDLHIEMSEMKAKMGSMCDLLQKMAQVMITGEVK